MKVTITPEYSAQRKSSSQNPLLQTAFEWLEKYFKAKQFGSVCDLGCGKLRHFDVLRKRAKHLTMVDTEFQVSRVHQDGDQSYSVREFIEKKKQGDKNLSVLNTDEFSKTKLNLDLIFLINVTDVVPHDIHLQIVQSASKNLSIGGLLIIIFPRNDTSITSRFNKSNQYKDGHYFSRGKMVTFMRNLIDLNPLIKQLKSEGLEIIHQHPRFRQVMIVARK